jgi:H+/Cl- antiporter ClcA
MKLDRKRVVQIAAAVGVVLGLVCPQLPEDYRPLCTAVASIASSC